jgi:hypothetical protein
VLLNGNDGPVLLRLADDLNGELIDLEPRDNRRKRKEGMNG